MSPCLVKADINRAYQNLPLSPSACASASALLPQEQLFGNQKSNQNKEQFYNQASPPATSHCPLLGASSTPRGHDGAKQVPTCVSQCLPILQGVKTPSPAPTNLHPSLPE